jgi:hypothetical protein
MQIAAKRADRPGSTEKCELNEQLTIHTHVMTSLAFYSSQISGCNVWPASQLRANVRLLPSITAGYSCGMTAVPFSVIRSRRQRMSVATKTNCRLTQKNGPFIGDYCVCHTASSIIRCNKKRKLVGQFLNICQSECQNERGGASLRGVRALQMEASSSTSYLEQHQSVPNQFCPPPLFGLLRCCCRTGLSVRWPLGKICSQGM